MSLSRSILGYQSVILLVGPSIEHYYPVLTNELWVRTSKRRRKSSARLHRKINSISMSRAKSDQSRRYIIDATRTILPKVSKLTLHLLAYELEPRVNARRLPRCFAKPQAEVAVEDESRPENLINQPSSPH
ncbi:uncharacterized protein RSE6_09698 [Rhynchosporium secalis]|uniref:Uncharacterized protein n=1 Tax=Rhynchosporium secalis TaxID=38038 RepID=A0A1E1MIK4_RHYSE|nr:uncharacterized protein RSE6_09698 [Rhynchosporium secalis]